MLGQDKISDDIMIKIDPQYFSSGTQLYLNNNGELYSLVVENNTYRILPDGMSCPSSYFKLSELTNPVTCGGNKALCELLKNMAYKVSACVNTYNLGSNVSLWAIDRFMYDSGPLLEKEMACSSLTNELLQNVAGGS